MLDEMVGKGIIAPIGDEPVEWIHLLVIVPKPGGKIRICVDFKHLNSQVKRVIHPMRTPANVVSFINKEVVSVLDSPNVKQKLAAQEFSPKPTSPEAFRIN